MLFSIVILLLPTGAVNRGIPVTCNLVADGIGFNHFLAQSENGDH
jgi:hypothetical protein